MACECGCGFEGEDDVTQFCIEEASMLSLDLAEAAQQEETSQEGSVDARPGEITDPELAEAMQTAISAHAQNFGVDGGVGR